MAPRLQYREIISKKDIMRVVVYRVFCYFESVSPYQKRYNPRFWRNNICVLFVEIDRTLV